MGNPNTREWWNAKFETGNFSNTKIVDARVSKYHFLANVLPKEEKFSLLDIGCATGYGLKFIKWLCPNADLHGIDISEVAIERARKCYPNFGFEPMDIQNHVFKRYFTYIIIVSTLEHLSNPFGIIDKCLEYATKAVVVSIPGLKPRYGHVNYFHLKDFNDYVLKRLPANVGMKLVIYGKKIKK